MWTPRTLPAAILLVAFCGCESIAWNTRQRQRAENHYVEGQLLADRGKYDQALVELQRAVEFDPNLSVAHSTVGDIHRKRGNYRRAVTSYVAACDADPYAFRPHYNLGVTYQYLAEAAGAVAAAGDYLRQAVEVYLRARAIRADDFDTNLNLSACYFLLDRPELAEKYCRAAIQCSPDRPEAYTNLGVIYDARGKTDQAIRAYKDSLEIDNRQPALLLNLGLSYMSQGTYRQAVHAFELAVDLAPDSPEPFEHIGACLYHMNRRDEAAKAFRQALNRDAESPRAHRGLGVVYMAQYLNDRDNASLREKALAAWRTSLRIQPDQPDLTRLVERYSRSDTPSLSETGDRGRNP